MFLRTHTPTFLAVVLLTGSIFFGSSIVGAVPTEEDLLVAQEDLKEVWDSAAESIQRRTSLETTLEHQAASVEQARVDLRKASRERRAVRLTIAKQRRLIESLSTQISAIRALKQYYDSVVTQQKAQLVSLIRFSTLRRMETKETGPVVGGILLRQLLRSSLGEVIDQEVRQRSLIATRTTLLDAIATKKSEATEKNDALQAMFMTLRAEVTDLTETYQELLHAAAEKTEELDNRWRRWELTDDELALARQEADEATARVTEMQQSLKQIHSDLRNYRRRSLTEQIATLQPQLRELRTKKERLTLEDAALKQTEEEELRALNAAMLAKNTDRRQYKTVERIELLIAAKRQLLEAPDAFELPGSITSSSAPPPDPEILKSEIAALEEKLEFLRQGIPEEEVDAYLRARQDALVARERRETIGREIAHASAEFATLQKEESDLAEELARNERNIEFDVLPPGSFIWPVAGPISAGFHDQDYEGVFHVPHHGIDIAVPQGTPVKAIADGFVYAVKDGGAKGYTYILIGHQNGYASLYGHLSSVLVSAGDVIDRGQVIGFSGGIPGTPGAGHMTTGAHVHLEIHLSGERIDPRTVLP